MTKDEAIEIVRRKTGYPEERVREINGEKIIEMSVEAIKAFRTKRRRRWWLVGSWVWQVRLVPNYKSKTLIAIVDDATCQILWKNWGKNQEIL